MATPQEPLHFDTTWPRVEEGLKALQNAFDTGYKFPFTNAQYMDLYTTLYYMCTQRTPKAYSKELYEKHREVLDYYLKGRVLPHVKTKNGEAMLREFTKRWTEHETMVRIQANLFHYIDRYYVKRFELPNLRAVGVGSFREHVFDEMCERVRQAILELILKERNGDIIDRTLVHKAVFIFVSMGLERPASDRSGRHLKTYTTEFEEPFLEATEHFYGQQAGSWLVEDDLPSYLIKAEKRLAEELERASVYLHEQTKIRLKKIVETKLLSEHQTTLLDKENSGFTALLNASRHEDLKRLYKLYVDVEGGLQPIAQRLKVYIEEEGLSLHKAGEQKMIEAQEKKQPVDAVKNAHVEDLVSLHERFYKVVTECFDGNTVFHKGVKDAFEVFVNKPFGRLTVAELLSNFCDTMLKKGNKMSEDLIEEKLEKVVRVFSYVTEKDLFVEFYRKQLAKRLLLQRSASDDMEHSMISKLKMQCGGHLTTNLEGMMQDISLSTEKKNEFSEYVKDTGIDTGGIDVQVTVLTTGKWPEYAIDQLRLPPVLVRGMDAFTQYYKSRTNYRKLRWVHSLGTATVVFRVKKKYELVLSTYQACVLLRFNEEQQQTFADIARELGLTEDDVRRHVNSLSTSKEQILLREGSAGPTIASSDVFRVNDEFSSKKLKIKMPLVIAKISQEEKDATHKSVVEDRKHAVEAAIVRVMKSRKTMNHRDLVLEASSQLMVHFKPDPRVIKARIEDLISREYLERDPNNQGVYNYLA
eukprot:Rmarinus@m.30199